MKTSGIVWFVAVICLLAGYSASAQSARQLTRKIVPPPTNPPPSRPVPPTTVTRQQPAAIPPAAPAAPVDPAKEKAKREETLKKTVEFQKKRAAEGSPTAQYDLGLRYLTGDGVEQNKELARQWLEASAAQGHAPAKRKLEEGKPK
jgi:TPR repeat protein